MNDTQKLLKVAEEYKNKYGLSWKTLGIYSARSPYLYEKLLGGGSCNTKTIQKAMGWFLNPDRKHHKAKENV